MSSDEPDVADAVWIVDRDDQAVPVAPDAFVLRYGPITNKLHQKLLENSAALPFLLALEKDYQPLTKSAQKAPIFSESTVRSLPSTEGIQSCTDALLYCLNQRGSVDIDLVADLADVTVNEALAELGGRVLWTPEGTLALSDTYLSGNIRREACQGPRARNH